MSKNHVLESVAFKGNLRGLCLELEVVQTFVNSSKRNIEAIYTFPLPFGAVLLDLNVKLGNKLLTGSVVAKKQAENDYENAITDGNSAIMLERADDGICTINVGNLLAGERAELRYRFTQLLNWQQDSLRITLPTTMAPRYGDPLRAGWQPHQVTEHSLINESPFSLVLEVDEPLSNVFIECPSHEVIISRNEKSSHISLSSKEAWLDRDFILNLTQKNVDKSVAQFAVDGDQHVALASFSPNIPSNKISSACIKIVVDCSGSMNGDSINQAKVGLLRILDNLREVDTFNIVRFGDTARAFFPICVQANSMNLIRAREAIEKMDADLGGTEMAQALEFAYKLKDEDQRSTSLLLITDGEVYEHEDIIKKAKSSNHRIFTVGVGSSVAESFIRNLAICTGGATELVSPNEGMAESIYRQFSRMFQQRATNCKVNWPIEPKWQSPDSIATVFAGDTLHLFAGFDKQPIGETSLQLTLEDGSVINQSIDLKAIESKDLSRVANAHRIENMSSELEEQATLLALSNQLISKYTNYLIIEDRASEEKPIDLPELAQVPHMLAAGYGGAASVSRSKVLFSRSQDVFASRSDSSLLCSMKMSCSEEYDIPAFLRKHADSDTSSSSTNIEDKTSIFDSIVNSFKPKPQTPIAAVVSVIESDDWYLAYKENVIELLSTELLDNITSLVKEQGWNEKSVISALLLAMLNHLENATTRHDKRELIFALKKENPSQSLIDYFGNGLLLMNKNWEWNNVIELVPLQ